MGSTAAPETAHRPGGTRHQLRPRGGPHPRSHPHAGKFRADVLAKKHPKPAWQRLSRQKRSQRARFYDWAHIALLDPRAGHRHLPIRRNHWRTRLLPLLLASAVPLTSLVRVAGSRWRIEEMPGPPRAWPASTDTRSAATPPGPAGSPWPCLLKPSRPCSAPTKTPTVLPRTRGSRSPATRSPACSSPSPPNASTTRPTAQLAPLASPPPSPIPSQPHCRQSARSA